MRELTKDRVIEALQVSATIKEAAKKVGCSERTIYQYLSDEEVVSEYRAIRASSLQAASDAASSSACKAINTLTEIMTDVNEKSTARVSAARVILETFTKLHELVDIEERLSSIERRLADEK